MSEQLPERYEEKNQVWFTVRNAERKTLTTQPTVLTALLHYTVLEADLTQGKNITGITKLAMYTVTDEEAAALGF